MGDDQKNVANGAGSSSPPENCCCSCGNEYQNSFCYPLGFRFKPTDCELIYHYLMEYVSQDDQPLLPNIIVNDQPMLPYIIKNENVYGSSPAVLTAKYKDYAIDGKEWYFFTSRERKYENEGRPRRNAGESGYWKATGNEKDIKDNQNNRKIGSKRTLVYHECDLKRDSRTKKGTKTDFKMQEFMLKEEEEDAAKPAEQHATAQDRKGKGKAVVTPKAFTAKVLCRIYLTRKSGPDTGSSAPPYDVKEEGGVPATDGSSTPPSSEDNITPRTPRAYYDNCNEEFVNPFPYLGTNLPDKELNEFFERELLEDNQTNGFSHRSGTSPHQL